MPELFINDDESCANETSPIRVPSIVNLQKMISITIEIWYVREENDTYALRIRRCTNSWLLWINSVVAIPG